MGRAHVGAWSCHALDLRQSRLNGLAAVSPGRRLLELGGAARTHTAGIDVTSAPDAHWLAAPLARLWGQEVSMTLDFGTALIVCALIASVVLALHSGARIIPAIALVACAIEALIAFRVIQLSSPRLRIDVVLPAVLVVTGGICWSRSASKSAITASTVLTIIGMVQLLLAIRVFR